MNEIEKELKVIDTALIKIENEIDIPDNIIPGYPENKNLGDIIISCYEKVEQHCDILDKKVSIESWEKDCKDKENEINNINDQINNYLSPLSLTKKIIERVNNIQKKSESLESMINQKSDKSELDKYEILYESLELKQNSFNDLDNNIMKLSDELKLLSQYIFIIYRDFINHKTDYEKNIDTLNKINESIETESITMEISNKVNENDEKINNNYNELKEKLNLIEQTLIVFLL